MDLKEISTSKHFGYQEAKAKAKSKGQKRKKERSKAQRTKLAALCCHGDPLSEHCNKGKWNQ